MSTLRISTARRRPSGLDTQKRPPTGWLVLLRLRHHDGRQFIAPTFCETKPEADMFASNFDNVVAITPIEWEE